MLTGIITGIICILILSGSAALIDSKFFREQTKTDPIVSAWMVGVLSTITVAAILLISILASVKP